VAKKLWTISKKEASQLVGIVLCFALIFWTFSCEARVKSLNDPLLNVTRLELQAELDYYLSLAAARFAQLDRQETFQRILFENAVLFSEAGTLNIQGLINTVLAVLGIGALTDNVRKRLDIKRLNSADTA